MPATPKTFIPGILIIANMLKRYFAKNSTTLEKYTGPALFALISFAVDLVIIIAEIIDSNAPANDEPWSDFNQVTALSLQQINTIQGAISKFESSIGIGS